MIKHPGEKTLLVLNNRYCLGQELGTGAFSTVFECFDRHTQSLLAAKRIPLCFKNNEKGRNDLMHLNDEVGLLKRLKHKNIVSYKDSFCTKQNFFILMEFMHLGSLLTFIKTQTGGNVNDLGGYSNVIGQILRGLEYLHSESIIHRDIKCANILISNDKSVKLSDFGVSSTISKAEEDSDDPNNNRRRSAGVSGSPNWMAPEVINFNEDAASIDFKCDIWSFGCLLVEILNNGRPPFSAMPSVTVLYNIANFSETILKDQILGNLHESVRSADSEEIKLMLTTIECCLTKDPSARPEAKDLVKKFPIKEEQIAKSSPSHDTDSFSPRINLTGSGKFAAAQPMRRRRMVQQNRRLGGHAALMASKIILQKQKQPQINIDLLELRNDIMNKSSASLHTRLEVAESEDKIQPINEVPRKALLAFQRDHSLEFNNHFRDLLKLENLSPVAETFMVLQNLGLSVKEENSRRAGELASKMKALDFLNVAEPMFTTVLERFQFEIIATKDHTRKIRCLQLLLDMILPISVEDLNRLAFSCSLLSAILSALDFKTKAEQELLAKLNPIINRVFATESLEKNQFSVVLNSNLIQLILKKGGKELASVSQLCLNYIHVAFAIDEELTGALITGAFNVDIVKILFEKHFSGLSMLQVLLNLVMVEDRYKQRVTSRNKVMLRRRLAKANTTAKITVLLPILIQQLNDLKSSMKYMKKNKQILKSEENSEMALKYLIEKHEDKEVAQILARESQFIFQKLLHQCKDSSIVDVYVKSSMNWKCSKALNESLKFAGFYVKQPYADIEMVLKWNATIFAHIANQKSVMKVIVEKATKDNYWLKLVILVSKSVKQQEKFVAKYGLEKLLRSSDVDKAFVAIC